MSDITTKKTITAHALSQKDGSGAPRGDDQIPQQLRRDYLVDVIINTIRKLVPADHKEFQEELEKLFPSSVRQSNSTPAAAAHGAAGNQLDSIQSAVQRLSDLAKESERARNEVFTALHEAGFAAPATSVELPQEPGAELRNLLQLKPGEAFDPGRVGELLTMLMMVVVRLERIIAATWQAVAPGSAMHTPRGVARTLGRFAVSDRKCQPAQAAREIDQLEKFVAALIHAIGKVAAEFSHAHYEQFSPEAVLASLPRSPWYANRDALAWASYKSLCAGRGQGSIQRQINQTLAVHVETVLGLPGQ